MSYKREKIKTKNHEWSFIRMGKGRPVILLHGINNYADFYLGLAEKLSLYFEVIVPDLPGFGFTKKYSPNSYQNIAAGLNDFVSALKLKNFNLFGSSMGGVIAVEYATHYKEFIENLIVHAVPWEKGIINLTTFEKVMVHDFLYHAKDTQLKEFQKTFTEKLLPIYEGLSDKGLKELFVKHREKIKESIAKLDIKGTIEVLQSIEDIDLGVHMGRINTNSLVVISELDSRVGIVDEMELARRLGDKRFVIVKDSLHDLPMSDPATMSKIILSFLNKEDYNSENLIWGKLNNDK